MPIASTNAREGERFPVGMAIVAWLLPIGFGLWCATQLGFESRTAGIPEVIWFTWFGATLGAFAAVASLLLIRLRARAKLPIAAPLATKGMAFALLVLTVVVTAVILTRP